MLGSDTTDLAPADVAALQRIVGNQAVRRLVERVPPQAGNAGVLRLARLGAVTISTPKPAPDLVQLGRAKPVVTNVKLSNYVNALFKSAPSGGVEIGDGTAMAACAHEKNGGEKVGGADHQEKCANLLRGMKKLLDKHANSDSPVSLSDEDLAVAKGLKTDLEKAIAGTYGAI